VNPECSTQQGHEIYDPCAPYSRLGERSGTFDPTFWTAWRTELLTLCEQGADALIETFHAFEQSFGEFLRK
jgi:carboxynorspermidine decarboxylase